MSRSEILAKNNHFSSKFNQRLKAFKRDYIWDASLRKMCCMILGLWDSFSYLLLCWAIGNFVVFTLGSPKMLN